MTADPRVHVAARALAHEMGVKDEWKQYVPEARAVLRAADMVDQLREGAA
ncbi:hypothetical protein [Arthrobacter pityocampae]